jgi:hypothetical protein
MVMSQFKCFSKTVNSAIAAYHEIYIVDRDTCRLERIDGQFSQGLGKLG